MAQVITEEDFPTYGSYDANLLTTKGEQIFANPNQLTEALNANPLLGGQYVLRLVTPGKLAWENPGTGIEIRTPHNHATPEYMYEVSVDDDREMGMAVNPITPTQEFRNKMNALKTVLENVGGPAGAARRRKNRKTKKASRRRRTTRRS